MTVFKFILIIPLDDLDSGQHDLWSNFIAFQ